MIVVCRHSHTGDLYPVCQTDSGRTLYLCMEDDGAVPPKSESVPLSSRLVWTDNPDPNDRKITIDASDASVTPDGTLYLVARS